MDDDRLDGATAKDTRPPVDQMGPTSTKRGTRWAVLVGISQYQHADWNLSFAHRDAEELHKCLLDPRCGGYKDEHIVELTDGKATSENIRRALYGLRKAGPDDSVLVFFSCHGGPDEANDFYLFPHDIDPLEIAVKGVAMSYVTEALDRSAAGRVLLLIDACHAGATPPGEHKAPELDKSDTLNRFLDDPRRKRKGKATITAALKGERAYEKPELGHGFFTYALLQGLRGSGPQADDGQVTLGALYAFVRDTVENLSGNKQHPNAILDDASYGWSMAVMGDLIANERHLLGRALADVGRRLGDPRRIEQAIREQEGAITLAEQMYARHPAARYEIGRGLMANRDYKRAAGSFREALDEAFDEQGEKRALPPTLVADLRFWIWAAAQLGADHAGAATAAAAFREQHAADPRSGLIDLASTTRTRRRRALLVGINEYRDYQLSLQGALNDVRLMATLLEDVGYQRDDIKVLATREATTGDAIRKAWTQFRLELAEDDEVVVYLACSSALARSAMTSTSETEVLVLPSDYDGTPERAITGTELHAALVALPARDVLVIADTCHGAGLLARARAANRYLLLSGTDLHQVGREVHVDGEAHGDFTYALVRALRQPQGLDRSAGELLPILRATTDARYQTPQLVGDEQRALFCEQDTWGLACALGLELPSVTDDDSAATVAHLLRQSRLVQAGLPEAMVDLGRTCLDLREDELARECFERVPRSAPAACAAGLGAAIAAARMQVHTEVEQSFADAMADSAAPDSFTAAREALLGLQGGRTVHALLVGVSGDGVAAGSHEDVEAMRLVVRRLCGEGARIEELLDDDGAATTIVERFTALAARAADEPCLFFFAGPGLARSEPALRGGCGGELPLSQLAAIARDRAKNLVCIIDAGFAAGDRPPWATWDGSRCDQPPRRRLTGAAGWVKPAATPAPRTQRWAGHRDIVAMNEPEPDEAFEREFSERRGHRAERAGGLGIGRVAIYNASLLLAVAPGGAEPGENIVEAALPSHVRPGTTTVQGVLTHNLVAAVNDASGPTRCSYATLQARIAERLRWVQPVFVGAAPRDRLLNNAVREGAFEREVRKVAFDATMRQAVALLDLRLKRIDERAESADKKKSKLEAHRELGIAHLAMGELDEAILHLRHALNAGGLHDPEVLGYLGRALVDQGDDLDTAVAHLQSARDLWACTPPGEVPAYVHYYYGKALHDRTEHRRREDSEKLEEAWQRYLDGGAPIGHRGEVRAYLARARR